VSRSFRGIIERILTGTMSTTDTPKSRLDEIRQAWRDANVTPLWETTAHKRADTTPRAYHWKWQVLGR